ncbi:MAG: NAD(P)H-hydrate dehydratase [Desulfobacterium sp.]|jgi:hypothetical protein|nr:NAD(P)H-hydrate dehydratase [Desulfobacterium sp.]
MFAVVGTVPDEDFPLVSGKVTMDGDKICIQGHSVPVNRGTPALLAAAIKTCETLNSNLPFGCLVGDIGKGAGSRRLYATLVEQLTSFDSGPGDSQLKTDKRSETGTDLNVFVFHYLQPDVDWHNRILMAMEKMRKRPVLIADAGFMYAAKMSGFAAEYDLFTPDAGELAFLADEAAPHPFYTRGFVLHEENKIPELIARAYEHENAARCLLVKGKTDYVVDEKQIHATVDTPLEDAMEAMGGTGDTLVGIVSALIGTGMSVIKAAALAAKVNRWAGHYARPTPATQVIEIIEQIPRAFSRVLREEK